MDFDWCEQHNETITYEPFNNSILQTIMIESKNVEKPITNIVATSISPVIEIKPITNINDCFLLTNIKTNNDVGMALQYLFQISNFLRNSVREDNSKFDFDKNIKYLDWILQTCSTLKNIFISNKLNDFTEKLPVSKLFKTSSYNFCPSKETCSVHNDTQNSRYGKVRKCNKHHFVFNYIVVDIENLIKSLRMVGKDSIDFLFEGGTLQAENGLISEVDYVNYKQNELHNLINKNTICKCFDVISFVINKMSHEINCFLTYGFQSNYVKLY